MLTYVCSASFVFFFFEIHLSISSHYGFMGVVWFHVCLQQTTEDVAVIESHLSMDSSTHRSRPPSISFPPPPQHRPEDETNDVAETIFGQQDEDEEDKQEQTQKEEEECTFPFCLIVFARCSCLPSQHHMNTWMWMTRGSPSLQRIGHAHPSLCFLACPHFSVFCADLRSQPIPSTLRRTLMMTKLIASAGAASQSSQRKKQHPLPAMTKSTTASQGCAHLPCSARQHHVVDHRLLIPWSVL